MQLTVNGETRPCHERHTVADLVHDLGLGDTAVAVEVNRILVPRQNHEATRLNDGDVIEIVTLVGGG